MLTVMGNVSLIANTVGLPAVTSVCHIPALQVGQET